jgi:hypothetical protein
MREIRAGDPSLDIEAVRGAVRHELRANRSEVNTGGGYWVLGTEPAAADAMEVRFVPLGETTSVCGLLVSEASTAWSTPSGSTRTMPRCSRRAPARSQGPCGRAARLEDKDPQCRARMRINPKDDATALLFEVRPGD